jgi:hypothetical protein
MIWDIPATITAVTELVNKFVPDRDKQIQIQAELQSKLLDLQQQQLNNQAEINKTEAASSSVFVAGWRPAVGWVCSISLAFAYIIQPVVLWIAAIFNSKATLPAIPTGDLFNLTLALLGLAGWRTLDKIKGVETTSTK